MGTPPPRVIFPESLDPLGIPAKTSDTPSTGFSTRVHLWINTTPSMIRRIYYLLCIGLQTNRQTEKETVEQKKNVF
jgi:hypothetical protein